MGQPPPDIDPAVEALRTNLLERSQFMDALEWSDVYDTLPQFLDVPTDAWYAPAVEYVVGRGLFSGTADNLFSPQKPMTRAMAVTVLYRLVGSPKMSDRSSFADVPPLQWYTEAVAWAENAGIISGCDDGLFHPDDIITLQELVSILYRYARHVGADVSASALSEQFVEWDTVTDWAAPAFAWAVGRGLMDDIASTELSPEGSVPRYIAAVIFQRYDTLI